MQGNQSPKQQIPNQPQALNSSKEKEDMRLISNTGTQQSSPNPDNVASMLRHGVGSVLDGLSDAKAKVGEARRLHEIALSVGDDQVATIIGHELGQVAAAAQYIESRPDRGKL